ncbi:hypothetical protein [Cytobacillus solani]|uniref:Uncharacterized protein n=1 Tax=Cytobacillus solani TaxID=1637975 RepID=A0A0Q3SH67_9BACI|nr:hypothetical protein [Cytobacillus solani]KQL18828.1 hypothetical protein AN957_09750 [Cytobacillus solani]
MKQFTLDLLYVLLAFIFAVVLDAIIYGAFGAVIYFGLPVLGVDITFHQAFILALLITVVGMLFRGGNTRKQTKGED